MERKTIADAIRHLESTLTVLDNAYWEASQIPHKDAIYDLIAIIHTELSELAKLSIEDHYMSYEPITAVYRGSTAKFRLLQRHLREWVMRSSTAQQLDSELGKVLQLHAHGD